MSDTEEDDDRSEIEKLVDDDTDVDEVEDVYIEDDDGVDVAEGNDNDGCASSGGSTHGDEDV